jgi:hypothetical protein
MASSDRDDAGVYVGPSEKTIHLKTAIPRPGDAKGDLDSITVREPTAKQLSQFFARQNATADDGMEALILLVSLTSGVPIPDVEKLRQRDMDACGEFLAVFTKAQQPISGASAS